MEPEPGTCARLLFRATSAEAVARAGQKMLKKYNTRYIRMILKKLIKKINKENAPPGGWGEGDKLIRSQAAGRRNQDHKLRVQASSLSQQAPGSGNPDKV